MNRSYFDPATREGENVNLVRHGCVSVGSIDGKKLGGRRATLVRKVTLTPVRPYAQYDKAVTAIFVRPGKRSREGMVFMGNNMDFMTIEATDGTVLYDSRAEVPVDMVKFNATAERFGLEGVAA